MEVGRTLDFLKLTCEQHLLRVQPCFTEFLQVLVHSTFPVPALATGLKTLGWTYVVRTLPRKIRFQLTGKVQSPGSSLFSLLQLLICPA